MWATKRQNDATTSGRARSVVTQSICRDRKRKEPAARIRYGHRGHTSDDCEERCRAQGSLRRHINALPTSCVTRALNPESNQLANHETDGVRAECQPFSGDGGAGSVTFPRRFGPSAASAASAATLRDLERETEMLRAAVGRESVSGAAFTAWSMRRRRVRRPTVYPQCRDAQRFLTADHCRSKTWCSQIC